MSELRISRKHGLSLKKARAAAEQVAVELGEEFSIDHEWSGNVLTFHRSGINGTMTIDKATVQIQAKIGFLLSPLKGRIEREIHRFCDENFGPEK